MELSQVALDTGYRQRCQPGSVSQELIDEVQTWLLDLVWSQRQAGLPGRWPGHRAHASDFGGGLVLTVYGEADHGAPLLTIGVARRASHGSPLWRVLTALPRAQSGLVPPRTPWCGVLQHGSCGAGSNLQAFIQACAWIWVQRPLAVRRAAPRVLAGSNRAVGEAASSGGPAA